MVLELTTCSQTSFGFGQVGGVALVLHPRYVLGSLTPDQLAAYKKLNDARGLVSFKVMSEMMVKNSLVKVKEHPPYTEDLEAPVLLNPLARTTPSKSGEYLFPAKLVTKQSVDTRNLEVLTQTFESSGSVGVGVDQGKQPRIMMITGDANCVNRAHLVRAIAQPDLP